MRRRKRARFNCSSRRSTTIGYVGRVGIGRIFRGDLAPATIPIVKIARDGNRDARFAAYGPADVRGARTHRRRGSRRGRHRLYLGNRDKTLGETNQNPAGVYLITPGGVLLDIIEIPQDVVTNCCFGGADLRTLYVTAGHLLFTVDVTTPGYHAGS